MSTAPAPERHVGLGTAYQDRRPAHPRTLTSMGWVER